MVRKTKPYLKTIRCEVCRVAGKDCRDQVGRPKNGWMRWSPPERWICPAHKHLKPGQWPGARELLARKGHHARP